MIRLLIAALLVPVLQMNGRSQRLDLQTALDRKLVSGEARSYGGYQGFCASILVRNLTRDSLIIYVEPGRRLKARQDPMQDILIVRREMVALKGREEKRFDVRGYCCQASDRAPSEGALYALNRMADSSLVAVARRLDSVSYDSDAEQRAIWAISDGHATAVITSSCDSVVRPLRRMVAELRSEPFPWYTVRSKTLVYRSGAMVNIALALKGDIDYSAAKDAFVTCTILNGRGIPVVLVKRCWMRAGEGKVYALDVPVKQLERGSYAVRLESEGVLLAERKFEI